MPRKKIHKEKTHEDRKRLMDAVGISDRTVALTIKAGLNSPNAVLSAKCLELAAKWRGFADVDKKADDEIKHLPIANINEIELDQLANRCAYCKHKKFEPLHKAREKEALLPELPANPNGIIETDNPNEIDEPTTQKTTD